jgi:cytochrome c oxidase subunit II
MVKDSTVRNRPVVQMVVIAVIASAIGIPIALIIPWFPTKGSIQAGNVKTLYDVLLIASVPIFVLVMTVILYSVWKFHMRPGEELKDGPPIHGNTRLEVIWTTLPAVLIISLCTYAYVVLRSNEKSRKGEMTINITARQFAFEFQYPETNGKTVVSSELYLANNQPVVFKLHSLDVIHSFFVPNFSEKIDAVPGITTSFRVTPTRVGTYPGECTELCGAGHSLMRATVRVVSPAAFRTWLAAQPANIPPPVGAPPPNAAAPGIPGSSPAPAASSSTPSTSATATAAAGKVVFTGVGGCSSCHTLAAAGATGTIGPNLDQRLRTDCQTAASQRIRGATLDECIMTAITKPYAYLPTGFSSGIMPSTFAQTLSSTQIQGLVKFLSSVAK